MAHGTDLRAGGPEAPDLAEGASRRPGSNAGFPSGERDGRARRRLASAADVASGGESGCPAAWSMPPGRSSLAINDRARELFGLRQSATSAGPCATCTFPIARSELRSLIERADAERRPIGIKEIEWRTPSGRLALARPAGRPAHGWAGGRSSEFSSLHRCHGLPPAHRGSWSNRTRSWRRLTRSCSPPTRSWRPPTRSSSPRWRSWRPPTRSSSRPTKSWRR